MVDALFGTWELASSHNFEEVLRALGVGFVAREVGKLVKTTNVIALDGDRMVVKMLSSYTNHVVCNKLGEEFDEFTPYRRKVKSTLTVQGNKLFHSQKWDGKELIVIREVKDDKMVMTLIFGDVTATRIFERK